MAEHTVELIPFSVPGQVTAKTVPGPRSDGFQEIPKFSLGELDQETLSELCNEFRRSVFKKAGKDDPYEEHFSPNQSVR